MSFPTPPSTATSRHPRARTICLSVATLIFLAGCGKSGPSSNKPADVSIKVDGTRHKCIVALAKEPQGNVISCDELASFIKEELRLPSGSVYELGSVPPVDDSAMTKARASLNDAGYIPHAN